MPIRLRAASAEGGFPVLMRRARRCVVTLTVKNSHAVSSQHILKYTRAMIQGSTHSKKFMLAFAANGDGRQNHTHANTAF